jgi:hypothetical protein
MEDEVTLPHSSWGLCRGVMKKSENDANREKEMFHRPNEKELSYRWRERGRIATGGVFIISCEERSGQRLAAAIG